MTNDVNARAIPVMGGWEGQFRKVHKAGWEAVEVNGIAQLYGTAEAAELAAWRALRAHLCADIVGSGQKTAVANADAEFRRIFPGKGRKAVEVVKR